MPGITGQQVNFGWAWCNTWGTPASVTTGALVASTEGMDGGPTIVSDDAFNQAFLGEGEVGTFPVITPEIGMQMRYEGTVPKWIAAAMGSAAAPSSLSSGANSITAFAHVVTLAQSVSKMLTLAVDESQYVLEVQSAKLRGFTVRVGENGRMTIGFPSIGNKPVYNSAVNTNSTVAGVAVQTIGTRMYFHQGVIRMNVQGAGALDAAASNSLVRDLSFGFNVPLSQDYVAGLQTISEPLNDGWHEFPVEMTFAQMNTVTANSLSRAFQAGSVFKADATFTSGLYINSTTQYAFKAEWPALQVMGFRAPVTGHNQVRPSVTFAAKQAASSPTGMAFVQPLRITVTNSNTLNLLA